MGKLNILGPILNIVWYWKVTYPPQCLMNERLLRLGKNKRL